MSARQIIFGRALSVPTLRALLCGMISRRLFGWLYGWWLESGSRLRRYSVLNDPGYTVFLNSLVYEFFHRLHVLTANQASQPPALCCAAID